MNIIRLHKTITLNVFALLALILYCNPIFSTKILNTEFKESIIIYIPLLAGLIAEFIVKKFIQKNKFNFEIKLPDKCCNPFLTFPLKILYLIVFYIGLSILFLPVNNIILGIILLSFIPINYLRKSIIANLFACLGFIWAVFCCWHYYDLYTPPIQAGLGNVVAFELFVCFIPISLIATVIFIACMFFEKKWHSKSEDYGKWFLHIPEVFHLLYLYIGLIGLMACALLIYTFAFLGIEIYIFEAITKILDIYL